MVRIWLTAGSLLLLVHSLVNAQEAATKRLRSLSQDVLLIDGKRMGRLTNCFSKKWANHEFAMALHFAHFNFCRSHKTLSKGKDKPHTPAMASGLAAHAWTVEELLLAIAG